MSTSTKHESKTEGRVFNFGQRNLPVLNIGQLRTGMIVRQVNNNDYHASMGRPFADCIVLQGASAGEVLPTDKVYVSRITALPPTEQQIQNALKTAPATDFVSPWVGSEIMQFGAQTEEYADLSFLHIGDYKEGNITPYTSND
jgi:hypothetical protein